MNTKRKVIFSGMQPTGMPSIGNYIGAIKNWAAMSADFDDSLFCVVDMHALTIRQNPDELRKKTRDLAALYIAAGLDPDKNILYCQSHVAAHAELSWVLGCYTYIGELQRMTQFKDKSAKNEENINTGLFTYPVLMAADILLYQAGTVPVGDDQKQHLELARDIAIRFNNVYGDTFVVPEPYIAKTGARIMGLLEPDKKMSKSDEGNPNNSIALLDEPDLIMKKIKRAVTDSDGIIKYSQDKPGVSNLLTIYGCLTGKTPQEAENDFEGMSYGGLKTGAGEAVIAALSPIQDEYKRITADESYINGILKKNAQRAEEIAAATMKIVREKIGLIIL